MYGYKMSKKMMECNRMRLLSPHSMESSVDDQNNDAIEDGKERSITTTEKSGHRESCHSAIAGPHLASVITRCEVQSGAGDLGEVVHGLGNHAQL